MGITLRENAERRAYNILADDPDFLREKSAKITSAGYTYDDKKLDNLIYEWMEKNGWALGEFNNIMGQAGLKAPFKFSNLKAGNYFECTDATGKKKLIRLHKAQGENAVSKIEVIEGNDLKIMYEVSPKTSKVRNCEEAVTCKSLTYHSGNRYLEWFGDEWKLSICMKKLDEAGKQYRWHILSIKMEGLYYNTETSSDEMEARKEKFNRFLLKERIPSHVIKLYKDMIGILYPDSEDYKCIEQVTFMYTEEDMDITTGKTKVRETLGECELRYDEIVKCTVNDSGDIYTYEIPSETDENSNSRNVSIGECWTCKSRSSGIPIIITRKGENYTFSTYGNSASMSKNSTAFREEFVRVNKRANQLSEKITDILA